MNFFTEENYDVLSRHAATIIEAQIFLAPSSVIGLATGSTPLKTYEILSNQCKDGKIDFSKIKTVNLDEYAGMSKDNIQSYRYFMDKNLFNNINIKRENTYVLNGAADDLNKECEDFEALIDNLGGIDLQLLGIGVDGHIGFNEPCEEFIKDTHIVNLDLSTIEANSRFFDSKEEVPKQALTMGIKSIMNAKKILLIANGKNKEEILNKAFYGPITPKVPASILQLHPDVTVIYSKD